MKKLKVQAFSDAETDFLKEYTQIMCPVAKALDCIQVEKQAHLDLLLLTVAATIRRLNNTRSKTLQHCIPLIDALLAGLKKRFGSHEEDLDCQLAAAFHPILSLVWLKKNHDTSKVNRVVKAMENAVQNSQRETKEEASSTFYYN